MIYFSIKNRGLAKILKDRYDLKAVKNEGPFQLFSSDEALLGISTDGDISSAMLTSVLCTNCPPAPGDIFVVADVCDTQKVALSHEFLREGEKTIYTDVLFDATDLMLETDLQNYGAVYAASKYFNADCIIVIKFSENNTEKAFTVIEKAADFQKENIQKAFDFTKEEEEKLTEIASRERLSYQRTEQLRIKAWKEKLLTASSGDKK